MTNLDERCEIVGPPRWDREAVMRTAWFVAVLVGILLLPILAHGCHGGDDLDLEPGTRPAENRR
ncbi:MAG: hypothetical protein U0791_17090 [Gemmataceae bacterium]